MRIAVDTGGTFSDVVVDTGAGVEMFKAPTTPDAPLEGVRAAIELVAESLGTDLPLLLRRVDAFVYGTTHALNAVVTGRTARTGLLTTAGHPDVLVLREGGRPDPFDYSIPTPEPYVPRSLTWEVAERVMADGTVRTAVDEEQVRVLARELRAADVDAVAVCLLWSSVNPDHERLVAQILRQELSGVAISMSSDVDPSIREYRRASATAIDASLKPLVDTHLTELERFLRDHGLSVPLHIVSSIGGLISVEDAKARPIEIINSGPALAPLAGRLLTKRELGATTTIVADTGGTTYDVSVVRREEIPVTRETTLTTPGGEHLSGFPSVDIRSVGAGGGSIALVDAGGMLHVGPASAGADPGPAAYGLGGDRPTVTDACLVLGYIDPAFFLGGRRSLDTDAARRAIDEHVASPLGVDIDLAASAVVEVATENMVQAIEAITINQGIDVSDAVLVGGGGAAGLNSAWISQRLGVRALLIPETGPALSAYGALVAPMTTQRRRTHYSRTDRYDPAQVSAVIESLVADVDRALAGHGDLTLSLEGRYPEQVWEIEVSLPIEAVTEPNDVAVRFHRAHEEIFGIADPASPVEVVSWCVTKRQPVGVDNGPRLVETRLDARPVTERPTYFRGFERRSTPVRRLDDVGSGQPLAGPAIIESAYTTIVVPPGFTARRTAAGGLLIQEETT